MLVVFIFTLELIKKIRQKFFKGHNDPLGTLMDVFFRHNVPPDFLCFSIIILYLFILRVVRVIKKRKRNIKNINNNIKSGSFQRPFSPLLTIFHFFVKKPFKKDDT